MGDSRVVQQLVQKKKQYNSLVNPHAPRGARSHENTVVIPAKAGIQDAIFVLILYGCFSLFSFGLFPSQLYGAVEKDVGAILAAAEAVFQNMSKGDYPTLWAGLTAETQRGIISNVRKAINKTGQEEAEALIRMDFEKGGVLAQSYWNAYLAQFNPKMVLEESTWKMGGVKKDKADIILRYKKAHNDAILQMYRESGTWKVGLEETFAPRRQ